MRNLQFLLIVVLAIITGYFIWQTVDGNVTATTSAAKTLQLTDMPITYCPKVAKIVTNLSASASRTGQTVTVTNCRLINLANIKADQAYIKLPHALSFMISPATATSYAPELGDVNEDGSINAADEKLVIDSLFGMAVNDPADLDNDTAVTATDLDRDGSVTATDLALVRLHQGVSITAGSNGDQIDWEDIE